MTGYVNQLNLRGVLTEALAFVVDHADKDEDPEQWTLTRELRAAISAPIAEAARVTDEDIDRMAKEMQSPTRPSDRAIAQAFWETKDDTDESDVEPGARSYGYRSCLADVLDRANELDAATPDARAGDCATVEISYLDAQGLYSFLSEAWQALGSSKTPGTHARDLYDWREKIYAAMRRLTTKATP